MYIRCDNNTTSICNNNRPKKAELVKNFGILLIIYAMFGEKYRKKVFEKIRTRK